MTDLDPSILDEGIRETVLLLRREGFATTDSGDGSKAAWMEGALGWPHVAIRLAVDADLVAEANRCVSVLEAAGYRIDPLDGRTVTASYCPSDGLRVLLVEQHVPVKQSLPHALSLAHRLHRYPAAVDIALVVTLAGTWGTRDWALEAARKVIAGARGGPETLAALMWLEAST